MADSIADYLAVTAPPPAAPAMPAMPKMRFADVLAGAFGAGPDRMSAYQKGIDTAGQFQLRSAQTESALAEAAKRRGEALRQSQVTDLVTRAQADPNFVPSVADLLTLSTGASDFTQGRLHNQEFGFRSTLADPNAAPAAQMAAGQGVQGKVMPHLYDVGGETVNMTTDPNATFQTPAQHTKVVADEALAGQRARGPAERDFTLGGIRYNADGTPVVDPRVVAENAAQVAAATAAARNAAKPGTETKPPNATQMKAIGQLNRMERTEDILSGPELKGYVPSLATTAAARVPGVGNYMVDANYQKYTQAAREWISGLLRLDSGAAVPETEFERYFRTFFPQPGDDDTVVSQKAEARAWATNSLRGSLGNVAPPRRAPGATPAAPATATPPGAGAVDPRVKQYADQYLGGDVAKATAILKKRGAIP